MQIERQQCNKHTVESDYIGNITGREGLHQVQLTLQEEKLLDKFFDPRRHSCRMDAIVELFPGRAVRIG